MLLVHSISLAGRSCQVSRHFIYADHVIICHPYIVFTNALNHTVCTRPYYVRRPGINDKKHIRIIN